MQEDKSYRKYVDRISRQEFISLFTRLESPKDWFTPTEMAMHSFPKNAGSLAARYLVKKRVADYLETSALIKEMEILNDDLGKPYLVMGNALKEAMTKNGIREIRCSLSHSRNHIVAMTVFQS